MNELTDPLEIWRLAKVLESSGHKRTGWYEAMKRGEAPRPIPLGPKTVGWLRSEVEDYIKSRIAKRTTQGATA
jgi:prophage regulatory protein